MNNQDYYAELKMDEDIENMHELTEDYCNMCNEYKPTTYEMNNGDYVCRDCYETYIDKAEYLRDDYLENEATGN